MSIELISNHSIFQVGPIDQHFFLDPTTGKQWLMWKTDHMINPRYDNSQYYPSNLNDSRRVTIWPYDQPKVDIVNIIKKNNQNQAVWGGCCSYDHIIVMVIQTNTGCLRWWSKSSMKTVSASLKALLQRSKILSSLSTPIILKLDQLLKVFSCSGNL